MSELFTQRLRSPTVTLADAVAASPATSHVHFDLHLYRNPPSLLSHQTEVRPDGWVKLHNGTEFIIELTSPWEENFTEAHERMVRKYSYIYNQWKLHNPSTFVLVFEVGARGKLNSTTRALKSLFGGSKSAASAYREKMDQRVIPGSFAIYQYRDNPTWEVLNFQQ